MNKRQYVLKEAERWKEAGIINEEQFARIAALYPPVDRGSALPLFAGVLLGIGVLTFIASNWDLISAWMKLALILLALTGCYVAGDWLRRIGRERVGTALTLTGVAVYGAGFFLIGQTFQVSADPVWAFYLWFLGAAAMAWHYRSPVLAAAAHVILAGSALYGEMTDTRVTMHAVWFAVFVGAVMLPLVWRLSVRWLAFLAVPTTLAVLTYDLGEWGGPLAIQGLYLAAQAAALALAARHRWLGDALKMSGYTAVTLYAVVLIFGDPLMFTQEGVRQAALFAVNLCFVAGLAALYLRRRDPYRLADLLPFLPILGLYLWHVAGGRPLDEYPLDLFLLLALFGWSLGRVLGGERRRDVVSLNLGAALFGISCLVGYVNFAWDFLDKSMFFLVGGALLLVLSIFLERNRRRWVGLARGDRT